jgi:hypothetical protein
MTVDPIPTSVPDGARSSATRSHGIEVRPLGSPSFLHNHSHEKSAARQAWHAHRQSVTAMKRVRHAKHGMPTITAMKRVRHAKHGMPTITAMKRVRHAKHGMPTVSQSVSQYVIGSGTPHNFYQAAAALLNAAWPRVV